METLDLNGNPVSTVGEYSYDGDGRRIKKHVPSTGEVTVFVYDAAGKSIAEYSTQISQEPKVSYTTSDHLGSPRILTDEYGSVISRRDFHPFGEEISTSERTVAHGYQLDAIRQKFTTYERDNETDLDFAQARFFDADFGRFSTPDPYSIVFEMERGEDMRARNAILERYLLQPQQWNKYPYAINNPMKYVDPTGEVIYLVGSKEEQEKALARFSEMMGKERMQYVSISRICDEKLGDVIVLGATVSNGNMISSIGATELNKSFSVRMADILESSSVVEYRFGESYTMADGTTRNLTLDGGAAVLGANESTTGNTQVWIHSSSDVYLAVRSASTILNSGLSSDGKPLSFTKDMLDAHEFGHAWADLKGFGVNSQTSKDVSVEMENAVRERYKSPQRRKGHR